MAYRLKPQESVDHGLRRLARKELKSARDELRRATPPSDRAIHEARKSLKKVRAIRELIEADDGAGVRGDEKPLRAISRTLSGLRDARAMLDVLKKLRQRNPRLFDEHTYARLRRQLSSHQRESRMSARGDDAWRTIDRDLRAIRRDVRRWRPRHRRFRALVKGLEATFRHGRKALARARKRQRADDFHEWRKQVKSLWYELRLIDACGAPIRRDVAALHRAEAQLGDDHNIVVLCEQLSKNGSAADIERVRVAAERVQAALRRQAIAGTRRIYARSASAYVQRLKRAWKAWHRRHDRGQAAQPQRTAA